MNFSKLGTVVLGAPITLPVQDYAFPIGAIIVNNGKGTHGFLKLKYTTSVEGPGASTMSFTDPGDHDWVAPDGVTQVYAIVLDAGSDGDQGHVSDSSTHGGKGGDGGSLIVMNCTVTPGNTYTVTVGDNMGSPNSNFTNDGFSTVDTVAGEIGEDGGPPEGGDGGHGGSGASHGAPYTISGASGGQGGTGSTDVPGTAGGDGGSPGGGGGGSGGSFFGPAAPGGKGGTGKVILQWGAGQIDTDVVEIFASNANAVYQDFKWKTPENINSTLIIEAQGPGMHGEGGTVGGSAGRGGCSGSYCTAEIETSGDTEYVINVGNAIEYDSPLYPNNFAAIALSATPSVYLCFARGAFNTGNAPTNPDIGGTGITPGNSVGGPNSGRSAGGNGRDSANGSGGTGGEGLINQPATNASGYGAGGGGGFSPLS